MGTSEFPTFLELKYELCFLRVIFLLQEPELLRVDAERIRRQMQEVAVNNYRAFISAADALLAIREEVSSVDKHLESLVNIVSISVGFYLSIYSCLNFDLHLVA